jgi:hypothetical protein
VDTEKVQKAIAKEFAANETRKQSTHLIDLSGSANLHSAFCCLNEDLPFWSETLPNQGWLCVWRMHKAVTPPSLKAILRE